MFTYAFMKLLEARPDRYDRAMDRVSRGRVRRLKASVAQLVDGGQEALEIGCGTGELAAMVVARGARVTAIDASEAMVVAARERIEREGLAESLRAEVMGVEAMDRLPEEAFDVALSTRLFSELSDDERLWALDQARRTLRPGGRLIIADEVRPRGALWQTLHGVMRAPAVMATYLIPCDVSRPLRRIAEELGEAGFVDVTEARSDHDTLALVTARRGSEALR